jgi:hypothetical protein
MIKYIFALLKKHYKQFRDELNAWLLVKSYAKQMKFNKDKVGLGVPECVGDVRRKAKHFYREEADYALREIMRTEYEKLKKETLDANIRNEK